MSSLAAFISQLGAKEVGRNGEWQFPYCWYCDGPKKAFFNVSKGIGYCVKCERPITIQDIAVDLAGVPLAQVQHFIEEHRATEMSTLGLREAVLGALLGDGNEQSSLVLPEIPLPENFRLLEDAGGSVIGSKAIAYMVDRGFALNYLYEMGFGYCGSGDYEGRVVIPFWEHGRLVYWQARDFTGTKGNKDKIRNPKGFETGKSEVLFNYDGAYNSDVIVLTESWGSAMAVSVRTSMGLNGQSLSDRQFEKIKATPGSTVIVFLDHGAEESAWSIAERLSVYKRTYLAFLPHGDPNEVSVELRHSTLRGAKQYSKADHIKFRVGRIT